MSESKNWVCVAFCVVLGAGASALASDNDIIVNSGSFTKESALAACKKSIIDADVVLEQKPKELPTEAFASVPEGDRFYLVVVDTKKWSTRDPKPGEKQPVLCDGSAPVKFSTEDSFPSMENYKKEREAFRKPVVNKYRDMLDSLSNPPCIQTHISLIQQNALKANAPLHCIPRHLYRVTSGGPWRFGDRKGGEFTTIDPNDKRCTLVAAQYRDDAVAAADKMLETAGNIDIEQFKNWIETARLTIDKQCSIAQQHDFRLRPKNTLFDLDWRFDRVSANHLDHHGFRNRVLCLRPQKLLSTGCGRLTLQGFQSIRSLRSTTFRSVEHNIFATRIFLMIVTILRFPRCEEAIARLENARRFF
jgi:hypothetical protein